VGAAPAITAPTGDASEPHATISRLADEDNENDEYHVPVPLPDVWADYRRLKEEEGWTQQQIADAKNINQALVSQRLRFSHWPSVVQQSFVKYDFLREVHACEMLKLLDFNNCDPWLTRDQALTEILDDVLKTHRGGSEGKATAAFAAALTEGYSPRASASAIAGWSRFRRAMR